MDIILLYLVDRLPVTKTILCFAAILSALFIVARLIILTEQEYESDINRSKLYIKNAFVIICVLVGLLIIIPSTEAINEIVARLS